jgi:hypothetical protein
MSQQINSLLWALLMMLLDILRETLKSLPRVLERMCWYGFLAWCSFWVFVAGGNY